MRAVTPASPAYHHQMDISLEYASAQYLQMRLHAVKEFISELEVERELLELMLERANKFICNCCGGTGKIRKVIDYDNCTISTCGSCGGSGLAQN